MGNTSNKSTCPVVKKSTPTYPVQPNPPSAISMNVKNWMLFPPAVATRSMTSSRSPTQAQIPTRYFACSGDVPSASTCVPIPMPSNAVRGIQFSSPSSQLFDTRNVLLPPVYTEQKDLINLKLC
jgi:hypothetical protein